MHADHDLALDQDVGVERHRVEGDVDRAFECVLERHDAEIDVTADGRLDDVGDGRQRHELTRGEILLREQSLLTERARRPEIADPQHEGAG